LQPADLYRGRFAPTPTGPLHFGSLVAATGSYLDARASQGEWLVRIEDIDTPRIRPGAADEILRQLESFGLEWSGPVVYQSTRKELYRAALESLRSRGYVYPCCCSRKEIADSATRAGSIAGLRYPGTCRSRGQELNRPSAWRIRTHNDPVRFTDRALGVQEQRIEEEGGDFVLLRADGVFAYQLAVVVDDAAQGITDVVRGADLLDSTFRQIFLQQALELRQPHYLHLPVATNARGEKLSKQTRAQPLNSADPAPELWKALQFLGHQPPQELACGEPRPLWNWALAHWSVRGIAKP